MKAQSSARRGHGFTLLELVVVLAAGVLLLGAMGSVLGGVIDTTRKVLADGEEYEEVALAERTMRTLLKAAIPPIARDAASRFEGKGDALAFRAVPPDSMYPFGELRVRLFVGEDTSGTRGLFLDVLSDVQINADPGIRLERYRLMGNVKGIDFRYVESADAGRTVRTEWTDPSRLPALIQVTVHREGDRPPVALSVAPRRGVNGRCRYDQIALACRG